MPHKIIVNSQSSGKCTWELPEPLGSVLIGENVKDDPTLAVVDCLVSEYISLMTCYLSKTIGGVGCVKDRSMEERMKKFLDISEELLQANKKIMRKVKRI